MDNAKYLCGTNTERKTGSLRKKVLSGLQYFQICIVAWAAVLAEVNEAGDGNRTLDVSRVPHFFDDISILASRVPLQR